MEVFITIGYFFLCRLIFVDYKLLKFNMFWQFVVFGIYGLAVLTEVVGLGQFAPYSETCYVQAYVVPMAPEYGGLLKKVNVESNQMVKKGDTLFEMDPSEWEFRLKEKEAQLSAAGTNVAILSQQVNEAKARVEGTLASLEISELEYQQMQEAYSQKAVALLTVEQYARRVDDLKAQLKVHKAALNASQLAYDSEIAGQPTEIAEAAAQLELARYNLTHSAILAPSNGYVTYLQVYPGSFIRLKTPIMTFVSTDEYWLLTQFPQAGINHINKGDSAEVALAMYPGQVFNAEVSEVYWSNGNAQGHIGGVIPKENEIRPGSNFMVRLKMEESEKYPLRFGASGIVAVYTKDAADILVVLRKLEIQSESFLDYVYNPFR
jgi:multidrug resistance efflux pump